MESDRSLKHRAFKTYPKKDDVRVQSKKGAVSLTGTVSDESDIWLAQEAVSGLPRVNAVNKLDSWVATANA